MEAYNDAVKRFKFECRYMAFVDGDEFILPKSKPTITEIVDDVLSGNTRAAGLVINWIIYGSNDQEIADYTRGVLDRFTRRDKNVDIQVKSVTNPRKVDFMNIAHFAYFFPENYSVNELGELVFGPFNEARTADKIQMNHYHLKSREEYINRIKRGNADGLNPRTLKFFEDSDKEANDVFDDNILKYRDSRRAALIQAGGGMESLLQRKQINPVRLINALIQNLFQTTIKGTPQDFFNDKIETFLTCLTLTEYLKEKYLDDTAVKFFEETSINAINRSFYSGMTAADLLLLLREMPKILQMDYPAVKNIRELCINFVSQLMVNYRMGNQWQKFTELDDKLEMLKSFR